MIRFFLTVTVFTLVLPPAVGMAHVRGWIPSLPSFLYETTWVVALTTSILFAYLFRSEKTSHFVQLYLLSMVVKLLGYFAFNLLMILEDPAGAAVNVVYFLIVYVLFTAAEITFLYRKISRASRP